MNTNNGFELERIAHQYLWENGYVVFPNVELFATRVTGTGNIDTIPITDLDALGIKFDALLEPKYILIDCKSRDEKVFSQILRVVGLSKILDLDDYIIVRDSVSETILNFAEAHNIKLMSTHTLNLKIKNNACKGLFRAEIIKYINRLKGQQSSHIKKLEKKLYSLILDKDNIKVVKDIIQIYQQFKLLYKNVKNDVHKEYLEYLFFQCFELMLITISKLASRLLLMSDRQFRQILRSRLIGDFEKKREIIKFLKLITRESDEVNQLSLLPSYTAILEKILSNIRKYPEKLMPLLRYNDYVIFEFALQKRKIDYKELDKIMEMRDKTFFSEINNLIISLLDENQPPEFLLAYLT